MSFCGCQRYLEAVGLNRGGWLYSIDSVTHTVASLSRAGNCFGLVFFVLGSLCFAGWCLSHFLSCLLLLCYGHHDYQLRILWCALHGKKLWYLRISIPRICYGERVMGPY